MYQFIILTVGKQKAGPHKELKDKFLKQLSPYAQITEKQVSEERFGSEADRDRALLKEAERIEKAIPKGSLVVCLDADGQLFRSEQFSEQLQKWSEQETRQIVFLVGGPLGLHDSIKSQADAQLSLSKMTFPHELALTMLSEQLYRAMTILRGKTYHY